MHYSVRHEASVWLQQRVAAGNHKSVRDREFISF